MYKLKDMFYSFEKESDSKKNGYKKNVDNKKERPF